MVFYSLCITAIIASTISLFCMDQKSSQKYQVGIAASSRTSHPESILKLAKQLKPNFIELKTSRLYFHSGHPHPHMVPINLPIQLSNTEIGNHIEAIESTDYLKNPHHIAFANSVGLPSLSLSETMQNIIYIKNKFEEEKLVTKLIFSVYGDSIEEFKYMAYCGNKLNVPYVCANLSCPNVENPHEPLYKNKVFVARILAAMKKELPNSHLIAKIGIFKPEEQDLMQTILCTIAQNGASGVYGINAVPMQPINANGDPIFGRNRNIAGISGAPIRNLALDFIEQAKKIIKQHNLKLTLFACGGVTDSSHVSLFVEKGADVVMSATAAGYNPHFSFRLSKL